MSRIYKIFACFFFIVLIVKPLSSQAQCYEDFYVYQSYPYGALCSPQYATLRAEYFSYGGNVNGEFRWYISDTDPNPVHTEYVSDFDLVSEYSLFASNGTTMWVSYFNYNTYCESYRTPYTFYISSSPTIAQDYATQCRYDPAKVQVSSNTSGVTFQLYKLVEYYDPYYGWVQNYQLEQSNTSGYFEIVDFNASTDADKYYVKVYQPYGCSTPYYYQLWFEITGAAPPVINGNTFINIGTGGTLYASGAPDFRWYDVSNNLVNSGIAYSIPSNAVAGEYSLNVQGRSSDGTCLTDFATVNYTVNHPGVTYTPLYNSSNFTKTIDLSKPVGTVAGAPGVTPTGGATYTIPIYTPPGTNGLQPSVSISYNSQSGNGVAGHGWNIGGLSAITRSGKNFYHNNIVSPVSYTNEDNFLLDGSKINAVSGVNGANGTIYALETENFSKIISYGGSQNNPAWFQVTAKDGTIMEFGNTSDSKLLTNDGQNVMLWRISKVQDIYGNYFEFKYENGFRESRVTEINYTGNVNTGLLPYNKVKFNYGTRQDKTISYEAGSSFSNRHLLTSIVIVSENNTVKTYQFNYGINNTTSLLKEVVETGSDGTSVNSSIYLYGVEPQNILTQSTIALAGEYDFFAGDFDADGKSDLLAAQTYLDQNTGVRLHSSYSLTKDINESSYSMLYQKDLGQNTGAQLIQDKKFFNFLTADYDGDGRDDVMELHTTADPITCYYYPYVRRLTNGVINLTKSHNSQTSYTDYQPFPFNPPLDFSGHYQYISNKGHYLIPGDFDGNGSKDFILILANREYLGNWGTPCHLFTYKAFLTSPSTGEINKEINNFNSSLLADADLVNTIDFDGDGKTEILVTKDNQTTVLRIQQSGPYVGATFSSSVIYTTGEITKDSKVYAGDFNGDRKTDLLIRNANGTWKILTGTGTVFISSAFSFYQTVTLNNNDYDDKVIISDFDGDGKSDILHGYGVSGGSRFSMYYFKDYNNGPQFFYEQYVFNGSLARPSDVVVGDFNGDGRSDLLNRRSVSEANFIAFKPLGKERLLSKITDGHNTTIEFQYKNLTDKASYPYFYNRTVSLDAPENTYPFNYIQFPLFAVSAVIAPNGIGGTNTVNYRYENAVLHRTAKGFLGFLKTETKDLTNGITSITENEINTEFAVPFLKKQTSKFTANNEILSEASYNFSFVNLSTIYSDPKRFFMRNDKTLTVDHITGAASENTNTYDNYGNITSSTAKIGALSGNTIDPVETVTTTTGFGIFNTPFPARPTSIAVSKTRTGAPAQSSTTTFSYNTNGTLASQTVFSGLPKSVTTSYSYNSFGNVTSVSVASAGLATRTSNATFDTKGRFALTKSILIPGELPVTETLTYDDKWGQPLSHTSGDCLTTLFEYDAFGRPKKTTFPTGVFVTNSLVWDVQNGNVFYSFTDYSGGSPDTKQWHDALGRPTKMQVAGFNNQWLTQLTAYNTKGKVASQTNTYYSNETPVTTTFSYDAYNRVTNTTSPVSSIGYSYTKLANAQFQVVTSNSAGQSTTKITDASGKVIQSIDNGGQLNFSYDSRGNQLSVTHGSNVLVSSAYDVYGRQTTLIDKNAGTITYEYDAFGQLLTQTDNLGNTYNMSYDVLGRVTNKQGPEGTTTYEYFYNSTTGCRNSNLTKVTGFGGVLKEFTYDAYHRMNSEKLTVDGSPLTTQYAYNNFGQLTQTTYPSGIVVNNSFDANGNLLSVTGGDAGSPVTLFTATAMNGFGQYTNYSMGNGKNSQITYNYGIPTRYYTQGVQDLNLNFNYTTGNLTSRYDAVKNLTENFQYDNLNRFNTASIGSTQQLNVNYDQNGSLSMGNIISKSDAGNYVYKNDKIHAVAYITNPAGATAPPVTSNTSLQQITYTPFLKTATITEDNYNLTFKYGPDYERVKTVLTTGGGFSSTETKHYFGNYEILNKGLTTQQIHYVEGGDGLCAIIVKGQFGTTDFYFVYKDHLGSLLTLTDINGNVVAEQNFDAWGRKRNPSTWQYTSVPSVPGWLYRGYTGHEHVDRYALINMNGRMYDPVQGRMLSPDNYVMPTGTQGYNRYSYANNNPLTYTDPDGNFIWAPIIAGAIIGGFINGVRYDMMGKSIWGGFWRGALVGAISGFGVNVAAGISASLAGGSFGAGFMGTTGATSTGFFTGALSGFGGGLSGGFFGGVTNGLLDGKSFGASLNSGGRNAIISGLSGGVMGGIRGGIHARSKNVNFFTGRTKVNLSSGFGAHNVDPSILDETIDIKYVGEFEKINVYESSSLGSGSGSGGITLPGFGITVGSGAYTMMSSNNTWNLLAHEFGHVLQSKLPFVGMDGFYNIIGAQSLASAARSSGHSEFWTETWANYLSRNYFVGRGINSWDFINYPIKDISAFNRLQFAFYRMRRPFPIPAFYP